jgi:hypothetical protein
MTPMESTSSARSPGPREGEIGGECDVGGGRELDEVLDGAVLS